MSQRPECRKRRWQLESNHRDSFTGELGGIRRTYKCSFCGFSEEKLVIPLKDSSALIADQQKFAELVLLTIAPYSKRTDEKLAVFCGFSHDPSSGLGLASSRLRLLAVFSLAALTISSTSFDGRGFCFGVVFFGIPKFPTGRMTLLYLWISNRPTPMKIGGQPGFGVLFLYPLVRAVCFIRAKKVRPAGWYGGRLPGDGVAPNAVGSLILLGPPVTQ